MKKILFALLHSILSIISPQQTCCVAVCTHTAVATVQLHLKPKLCRKILLISRAYGLDSEVVFLHSQEH